MIRQASFPILFLSGPALDFAIKGFAPILALAGLAAILALLVQRSFHRPALRATWRDLPAVLVAAFAYGPASAIWGISERAVDTGIRLMLVVSFACAVIVVFNNLSDEQRMR